MSPGRANRRAAAAASARAPPSAPATPSRDIFFFCVVSDVVPPGVCTEYEAAEFVSVSVSSFFFCLCATASLNASRLSANRAREVSHAASLLRSRVASVARVGDAAPAYVRRWTFSSPVSAESPQGRLSLKRAPSSVRASPSPVRLTGLTSRVRGSKPSRLAALEDTRRLLGVQGDDAARVLCPRSPKRPSRRARARSRAASRSRCSSAARGEGSAALGARHAGVRRAAAEARVSSSRADGTETKSRRATPTTRPIDAGGFRPRATPAPGARDTKREPRFAGFCFSFAAAFVFARRALFCVFRVSSVSFASLLVAALAHPSPSIARAVPAAGGTSALASSSAHASPATEAKCSCRLASASRAPARRR